MEEWLKTHHLSNLAPAVKAEGITLEFLSQCSPQDIDGIAKDLTPSFTQQRKFAIAMKNTMPKPNTSNRSTAQPRHPFSHHHQLPNVSTYNVNHSSFAPAPPMEAQQHQHSSPMHKERESHLSAAATEHYAQYQRHPPYPQYQHPLHKAKETHSSAVAINHYPPYLHQPPYARHRRPVPVTVPPQHLDPSYGHAPPVHPQQHQEKVTHSSALEPPSEQHRHPAPVIAPPKHKQKVVMEHQPPYATHPQPAAATMPPPHLDSSYEPAPAPIHSQQHGSPQTSPQQQQRQLQQQPSDVSIHTMSFNDDGGNGDISMTMTNTRSTITMPSPMPSQPKNRHPPSVHDPSISQMNPLSFNTSESANDQSQPSFVKNIGSEYIQKNQIIPHPSVNNKLKQGDKAEIGIRTSNPNFAMEMVGNMEKNVQYSSQPDKYTIRLDDSNNLHIWVNKHIVKYQHWQSDLNINVPLLRPTETLTFQNYSTGSSSQSLVASLFDVDSEQKQTNCWFFGSINDKNLSYKQNSMQWVVRANPKTYTFHIYNCTGVQWCPGCVKAEIKRNKQRTRINETVEQWCELHNPPRLKHIEQCAYLLIVCDHEQMTKDQEFHRIIVRINCHTSYCAKQILRAKPSSDAWIMRSVHAQDPSGNEAITSRYYHDSAGNNIQIGQIDAYYHDKDKVKNVVQRAKELERKKQGVDSSISKFTDWRFLLKGIPAFLSETIAHFEITDDENKMIILRVKFCIFRLLLICYVYIRTRVSILSYNSFR